LAASITYWANAGQSLILKFNGSANATTLATWLASSFPTLYGVSGGSSNLTGKTNTQVAALFVTLYNQPGLKLEAEVLATALNIYATTQSLGGNTGAFDGFLVDAAGLGGRMYNVGLSGPSVALYNNTSYLVSRILKQISYRAVNGVIWSGDLFMRNEAFLLFDGINRAGGL
jgi:hypothetical protein